MKAFAIFDTDSAALTRAALLWNDRIWRQMRRACALGLCSDDAYVPFDVLDFQLSIRFFEVVKHEAMRARGLL